MSEKVTKFGWYKVINVQSKRGLNRVNALILASSVTVLTPAPDGFSCLHGKKRTRVFV